jgi:ABC-2 type transport system ATP-binding protein
MHRENGMNEPLLKIHRISVRFGRLLAVDDLSMELSAGGLLGLIGPNGAGKTTTLRAAAGLQPLTSGHVRVLGLDVFKDPTVVGHHLGFTPDTPAVYDALTVSQFLAFIGRCYDLPPRLLAERIDHWLEQLWLTEKRDAPVKSLSRGMRQRLAVARTLLPDPHVILLDEPAAGLDPGGRIQFRRLLASLRDQGKAIIVSSHILADLAEYCTHIVIMEHGRMLRYGTVAQVAAAEHQRCRYRVLLAYRLGDLAARLAPLQDLTIVQADGDLLTVEFDHGREAAAGLLRRLLAAGLPIAEFRVLQPDLEQAYLRSGVAQVD